MLRPMLRHSLANQKIEAFKYDRAGTSDVNRGAPLRHFVINLEVI
jgi:hypothetical protein